MSFDIYEFDVAEYMDNLEQTMKELSERFAICDEGVNIQIGQSRWNFCPSWNSKDFIT